MMAHSEDHIALAAEYALGTLEAGERVEAEALMAGDHDFAALVEAWERKLGPLNQMVGLVEPPPELWDRIKAAAGLSGLQQPFEIPAPPIAVELPAAPVADEETPPPAGNGLSPESRRVVRYVRMAYLWGAVAATTTAIAASLAGLIIVQLYSPDTLPNGLRPKIRTQVVQVQAPPPPIPAQYVAVLQRDSNAPAFILTVDAATKNFTVRKVGATPEPGKSYELWLVSDKLQRPRSLGVIGSNDFTVRPALSVYDTETVNKATYAVTVEPEGGSPTGVATGPIVFTGKLIESVPSAPPPR
jgi:anti-sigma-K factor RskA